jgi:hypothetical protein
MAAHPKYTLAANPQSDDYLHELCFTKIEHNSGRLSMVHGDSGAIRGTYTANYRLENSQLILSIIRDQDEPDDSNINDELEEEFSIPYTIETGPFVFFHPYNSDSFAEQKISIYTKRFVFEFDPFSIGYLQDRHNREKYQQHIQRTLEYLEKQKQINLQKRRLFADIHHGMQNVYYNLDHEQESTVELFLNAGNLLPHYCINHVDIKLVYNPTTHPMLDDVDYSIIQEIHQAHVAAHETGNYNHSGGIVFLHASNGNCLASAIYSYDKIGFEERAYTSEELASFSAHRLSISTTYSIPIYSLILHSVKWSSDINSIDNNDLLQLKDHFYRTIGIYLMNRDLICNCTYATSINPADIADFESIYGLVAGQGFVSRVDFDHIWRH